jgi:hypothetical protein
MNTAQYLSHTIECWYKIIQYKHRLKTCKNSTTQHNTYHIHYTIEGWYKIIQYKHRLKICKNRYFLEHQLCIKMN